MADPEQSLDAVLGGLLTALTGAQDQSNRLSRSLALAYRDDALLRQLSVPVGAVEDAEFDIAFAIDGIHDPARLAAGATAAAAPSASGLPPGQGPSSPSSSPGPTAAAASPSPAAAAPDPDAAVHLAAALVVRALRDMADHAQDAGRTSEADQLARLAAAAGSSRFEQYLAGEVDRALSEARERAQLSGRGSPDAAARRRTVMGVLEERLLNHPDLTSLVGTGTRRGSLLRDRIAEGIGAGGPDASPAPSPAAGGGGTPAAPPEAAGAPAEAASPHPTAPALGIAVEAGLLARLPAGMLDRMKVRTTMHGLRWKVVRDEDGTPQYVLHTED